MGMVLLFAGATGVFVAAYLWLAFSTIPSMMMFQGRVCRRWAAREICLCEPNS